MAYPSLVLVVQGTGDRTDGDTTAAIVFLISINFLKLASLAVQSPVVTICTTRFNIQQFYILPTQCIYAFCVDLRTNSGYFSIQH
jgi:hypothetical protein